MSGRLSDAARALLPAVARAALEAAVQGRPAPSPHETARARGLAWPPEAEDIRGVFVTLKRHGRLRGCIGMIEGHEPLTDAVVSQALEAAFRDPRFEPLTPDELPDVTLEVSVLTPLRPVADWHAVEIPRHGVLLGKSGRRAVFLPQVAAEMGWDRATTLSQLCLKAGLPGEAWRDGADFQVFEAEAVSESGHEEIP